MTKQYWTTYFDTDYDPDHLPDWECPVCLKGILHRSENSIKAVEAAASKRKSKTGEIDVVEVYGNFIGILTCNHKDCGENVMFAGTMGYVPEVSANEDGVDEVQHIFPKYFNPALRILPYKSYLPSEIQSALMNSFEVFWVDNSACANAVRKVAEVIMDDKKIPRTIINIKKKKTFFSLHQRIDRFKVKSPEVAEMLHAIKFIGNDGSHSKGSLKRSDIWDAYNIIDLILEKLYNKEHKDVIKTAKSIVKSKGIHVPRKKFKYGF